METNALVQLVDVCAGYPRRQVLAGVNMTIYADDFLGVIGPNGGGKTTLVKLILGLLAPVRGNVCYFKNGVPCERLKTGYLPQYNAFDTKFPISARGVILSGLYDRKMLGKNFTAAHQERVEEVLQQVELYDLADCPLGEMSGGERQRVLLGRAIVSNPDLLILDEPSTYIDKHTENKLYTLLESINRTCAIVLVSHDIGTVVRNVRNIACVDGALDYHSGVDVSSEWLEQRLGSCPFELVAHGNLPHRVLRVHPSHE